MGERWGRWSRWTVCVMVAMGLSGQPPLGAASTPVMAAPDAELPFGSDLPATQAADVLPTVQHDGVAWTQTVIGQTVFVGGLFTRVWEPDGTSTGEGQKRQNLFAYHLQTGALLGHSATFNGAVTALQGSRDGTRLFVGGDFTSVNDQPRRRFAVLETATGRLLPASGVGFDQRVSAIVPVGDTLVVAGAFTRLSTLERHRVAALNAQSLQPLPWAPKLDDVVLTAIALPDQGSIAFGGRFTRVGGKTRPGLAVMRVGDSTSQEWSGLASLGLTPGSSVPALATDAGRLFVSTEGATPNAPQGVFALTVGTGQLTWSLGCRGTTYALAVVGQVLYQAGPAVDCGMVDGQPAAVPRSAHWLRASTVVRSPYKRTNSYGGQQGRLAAEPLHFVPDFPASLEPRHAIWSLAAAQSMLLVAGDFSTVNGAQQRGAARFGPRSIAPRKVGPRDFADTAIQTNLNQDKVRVSWTAAWDPDDDAVTYQVLRAGHELARVRQPSTRWFRPRVSVDVPARDGGPVQTFTVRAVDPSNNSAQSASATVRAEAAGGTAMPEVTPPQVYPAPEVEPEPATYIQLLGQDEVDHLWPLHGDTSTTSWDALGGLPLKKLGLSAATAPGPVLGMGSWTLDGGRSPAAVTSSQQWGDRACTVEAWIKTTTTTGGHIVGFGNEAEKPSLVSDRHLYLRDDGRAVFGIWGERPQVVVSRQPVNDGGWHHLAGTISSDGMALYVDGVMTAVSGEIRSAAPRAGYWRVGGDSLTGWPGRPSAISFTGSISAVAITNDALTDVDLAPHVQRFRLK